MTRQQKLDALAQRLGYKNYNDYRNALAQGLGYKNYTEQRKARRTGVGLQPADVPGRRRGVRGLPARPPIAPKAARAPRVYLPPETVPTAAPTDLADLYSQDVRLKYKQLHQKVVKLQQDMLSKRVTLRIQPHVGRQFTAQVQKENQAAFLEAAKHAKENLPKLFESAALAANDEFVMGETEKKILERFQREAVTSAQRMMEYTNKEAVRVVPDALKSLKETPAFIQRQGIRGIQYRDGRKYSIASYGDMAMRSNAAGLNNSAVLAAIRQSGVEVVEVSDGVGCGWDGHRDPDKANGTTVSIEFAEDHMLSHPYCQRQFHARPDLKRKNVKNRLLQAAAVTAAVTGAIVTGAAIANQVRIAREGNAANFMRAAVRKDPEFIEFEKRIQRMRTLLGTLKNKPGSQLYDLVSRLPIVQNEEQLAYYFAKAQAQVEQLGSIDVETIADLVNQYADVPATKLPAYVKSVLGIAEDARQEAVNDAFTRFSEYSAYRYKFMNSMTQGTLTEFLELQERALNEFIKFVGPVGPRWARFSMPLIRGEQRLRWAFEDPTGFIKYTRTTAKKEAIHRLTFNRNGLLRAGFVIDPNTGRILPEFRLISKGPLRIFTKINRSTAAKTYGKVLSASIHVDIITGTPIDFSAAMNLKLRALGIYKWEDILKLTAGDFRRLINVEPNLLTFVRAATAVRTAAPTMGFAEWITSADYVRIYKMPIGETRKIFSLSNIYLADQLEKIKDFFRDERGSFMVDFTKGEWELPSGGESVFLSRVLQGKGQVDWANLFNTTHEKFYALPNQLKIIWLNQVYTWIGYAIAVHKLEQGYNAPIPPPPPPPQVPPSWQSTSEAQSGTLLAGTESVPSRQTAGG